MPDASQSVSQALDRAIRRLQVLHDQDGLSWREIASLPDYEGVTHSALHALVAYRREPKDNKTRVRLGLPPICQRCGEIVEI